MYVRKHVCVSTFCLPLVLLFSALCQYLRSMKKRKHLNENQ